jgi:hypothetical protein
MATVENLHLLLNFILIINELKVCENGLLFIMLLLCWTLAIVIGIFELISILEADVLLPSGAKM